jgi:N-methylhydantoinase A/oxoprolinase/acetone carboxylase beta subunit
MSIVGIDIGGTFTDLVGYRDGAIVTAKTLTVPADPTVGAATALRSAGCDVAAVGELLMYLAWGGWSTKAILEGRSFFSGKLGQQVLLQAFGHGKRALDELPPRGACRRRSRATRRAQGVR